MAGLVKLSVHADLHLDEKDGTGVLTGKVMLLAPPRKASPKALLGPVQRSGLVIHVDIPGLQSSRESLIKDALRKLISKVPSSLDVALTVSSSLGHSVFFQSKMEPRLTPILDAVDELCFPPCKTSDQCYTLTQVLKFAREMGQTWAVLCVTDMNMDHIINILSGTELENITHQRPKFWLVKPIDVINTSEDCFNIPLSGVPLLTCKPSSDLMPWSGQSFLASSVNCVTLSISVVDQRDQKVHQNLIHAGDLVCGESRMYDFSTRLSDTSPSWRVDATVCFVCPDTMETSNFCVSVTGAKLE